MVTFAADNVTSKPSQTYHVGVNMHYLVWFGGHQNQLQRSPLQCPWSGIVKKVYHVGVNMHYLVWFGLVWWSPKSAAEVFIALSLVLDFQKGICRG